MTETEVPELTPEAVRALAGGSVTFLKPGETLVIRVADWTPNQVREANEWLGRWHAEGGLPFPAFVLPGDEFAVAEPGSVPVKAGRIIIEWPAPRNGAVSGQHVRLSDADTGDEITTATRLAVHAEPGNLAMARVTVLADAEGSPVYQGRVGLLSEQGRLATVDVEFEVAEMRTAKAAQ